VDDRQFGYITKLKKTPTLLLRTQNAAVVVKCDESLKKRNWVPLAQM
jgi:hypothetical protein